MLTLLLLAILGAEPQKATTHVRIEADSGSYGFPFNDSRTAKSAFGGVPPVTIKHANGKPAVCVGQRYGKLTGTILIFTPAGQRIHVGQFTSKNGRYGSCDWWDATGNPLLQYKVQPTPDGISRDGPLVLLSGGIPVLFQLFPSDSIDNQSAVEWRDDKWTAVPASLSANRAACEGGLKTLAALEKGLATLEAGIVADIASEIAAGKNFIRTRTATGTSSRGVPLVIASKGKTAEGLAALMQAVGVK